MKKLLLPIICALCIVNYAFAQTECSTISEVRALANETSVIYTGTATTTFYGPGGVLIQDETGYIYVKCSLLGEWGTSKVRANMQITNIKGKFMTASDMEMTHIEVTNRTASSIQITNENATFDITDITIDELVADPMKYECRPVRLTNIEVINSNYSNFIGNAENKIPLVAGWDVTIPARGTFEGYYGNNGSQGFVVPSAKYVTPTAFKGIVELKNAYETEAPATALGLVDAALVNYVKTNSDGSAHIYVQQSDEWGSAGVMLVVENYQNNIAAGDSINGIKGVFTPFTADDLNNITGSKIIISEENAKLINVVNSKNKLNTTLIDDLEYVIGWGAKNYEATLGVTPKGKITKADGHYNLVVKNKYIRIEGIDVSAYEGENFALVGIIDAGHINEGETSIVLRSEVDIMKTSYTFNSIAEMKAAGEPLATGTIYSLNCNVLVTHTYSWATDYGKQYGFFVQDATGGLYIETGKEQTVVAGDSINRIVGTYINGITQKEDILLNVVSSNHLNEVEYEEVTMATLATNPEKYASRVVKLMGVQHDTRTENHYGEVMTIKYLFQDEYTMDYDIWDYELYEYNNIIGVFDYGSYQHFSIVPLSQNHIEEGKQISTNIENTNINDVVFAANNQIMALEANNIKVYNINGQFVGEADGNVFNASDLNKGVYIVVTTNDNQISTNKVIIK